MTRRIATVTLGLATALALTAGPAVAHPHSKAKNGFVGPAADSPAFGAAHSGIQCAAEAGNPNLTPLDLDCPKP